MSQAAGQTGRGSFLPNMHITTMAGIIFPNIPYVKLIFKMNLLARYTACLQTDKRQHFADRTA